MYISNRLYNPIIWSNVYVWLSRVIHRCERRAAHVHNRMRT
jgi:hypothetical protein